MIFSVSGILQDEAGIPVAGAMISVPVTDGRLVSAVTDERGNFHLFLGGGLFEATVQAGDQGFFFPVELSEEFPSKKVRWTIPRKK